MGAVSRIGVEKEYEISLKREQTNVDQFRLLLIWREAESMFMPDKPLEISAVQRMNTLKDEEPQYGCGL